MGNSNGRPAAKVAGDVQNSGKLGGAHVLPSGHRPSVPRPVGGIGRVLGRPMEDVREAYIIGSELGRGTFGVTYLCTQRKTGKVFACKSIATRKLVKAEEVEDVRREVQIMHHMTGHRNVVELKGVYEDNRSVNLVMELCSGGELLERIVNKGYYSERAAAAVFREVVTVVHSCHSMGVMHRDLKPENFLFRGMGEKSPLKVADFGISVFFKSGDTFTDLVGSPHFMAPEVLHKNYGAEADIWSAGVILYILLSGVPPFQAGNERGIFQAILRGHINFSSDPWPSISDGAKELIKNMLQKDPKERFSAVEILNHPWVRQDGEAPDRPLDSTVLTRMKQFRAMNKFKKAALKVIAENLPEDEIIGLKEMCKSMDTDNDGTITFEELRAGLRKLGTNISGSEVNQFMEGVDVDGNAAIDYIEFITATVHMNKIERDNHLYTAFEYFDKDKNGYITTEELELALDKYDRVDGKTSKEIIADIDTDEDGKINYEEFVAMMKKGNPDTGHNRPQK